MSSAGPRFSHIVLIALLLGAGTLRLASQDSQARDVAVVQRLNRDREAALRALDAQADLVKQKREALAKTMTAEGQAVRVYKDRVKGQSADKSLTGGALSAAIDASLDLNPEVGAAKGQSLLARAELQAALAAEKAAKEAADTKEAALDDFLGNVEPPQWMSLWLLGGVNDLIKANTDQGSSNIKGASIELGLGNPSRWQKRPDANGEGGIRYPGYYLGGVNFTLLNSDPLVVESQDATTGTTKISSQKTYASKSNFEAHFRLMKWTDPSTQEMAWGLIVAGARVISGTNHVRTTTAGGTTTVEQLDLPTNIQYTTWKAALRYEFTYGSGYVYQGTFAEAGYFRDPGFIEKPDRMFFRGHWSANILGGDPKKSGRFFVEGQYLTGRGAQDRASVIIGYQANLADVRKAMGF